jgi:predicted PurR-regulated permease PerM
VGEREDGGSVLRSIDTDRALSIAIRIVVWWTFFGVLYLLKSFFLLIFLTFVFAYIQSNLVERFATAIEHRTLRVFLAGLLILGVLVAIGAFVVPQVREEATVFVEKFPLYVEATDREIVRLQNSYPMVGALIPEPSSAVVETSPSRILVHKLLSFGDGAAGAENVMLTIEWVRNIGVYLAGIGSAFFLSLLFSFLIVLDLPSLQASARSLSQTKLAFVYNEVWPSLSNFAQVMGRAIEAQLFIAILNTFLTGLGLILLGISSKLAFISLIVFGCSFIPVAGVFISSLPICLMALQDGGLMYALLAVGLIIVIHMIEAYILNPRIYGHHLRMNPVVVLIILTVSGKLFHVWGLILGVPLCTYIFGHAIQYRGARPNS